MSSKVDQIGQKISESSLLLHLRVEKDQEPSYQNYAPFLMKRFSIALLSLLLLYPRVAWAVEACLHSDGHSSHVTSAGEPHHDFQSWFDDSDSLNDPVPEIHCPSRLYQVDPAGMPPTVQLRAVTDQAWLHVSFVIAPAVTLDGRNLWLRALFRKILAFPFHTDLPHHLYFSVLRI